MPEDRTPLALKEAIDRWLEDSKRKKGIDEMKKRFEEYLNELTRGKEPGKVRIILE